MQGAELSAAGEKVRAGAGRGASGLGLAGAQAMALIPEWYARGGGAKLARKVELLVGGGASGWGGRSYFLPLRPFLGVFLGFLVGLTALQPVTVILVVCLRTAPFWATISVGMSSGAATVSETFRTL